MEFHQVSLHAGNKTILQHVSGVFPLQKLTAILGASGSGKSSLLSTLAFNHKPLANGYISLPPSITHPTCEFVHQDDAALLFGELTVKETLVLAAYIIGRDQTHVDELIKQLGLQSCENTRIGTASHRGVSGGERKRVSLAKALLSSPSFLFADEPTSGLDSASAILLMKQLAQLCTSKMMTVICSLHQPPKPAFDECACIAIMHQGRLVFCESMDIQQKFQNKFNMKFPQYDNIADVMLQTVTTLENNSGTGSNDGDEFKLFPLPHTTLSLFTRRHGVENKAGYVPRWLIQVRWLVWRSLLQKSRNGTQVMIPASNAIVFGLLLGGIYFNTFATYTQAGMQNWVGLCFFVCLNQAFAGAKISTDIFPSERIVVRSEKRYYGPSTYLVSSIITSWLVTIWWPILFTCIVIPMAGEGAGEGSQFGVMILILTIGYIAHAAFGMLIGAFFATATEAADVSGSIILLTVLFSGFYAQTNLIPDALAWIQWISPLRYMFGGLMASQFHNVQFTCANTDTTGCIPTGDAMLARMGLENDTWQGSTGILCGFTIGFYVLTWMRLMYV